MGEGLVSIRAVICDVYHTLLEVGPPPTDAGERWDALCREVFGSPRRLSLDEFAAKTSTLTAHEHAAAKALGVIHPEIVWPSVAGEALPDLANLSEERREEFLYRHAQLQRSVNLVPGAAEVLSRLSANGTYLGIASNAQSYTLCELDAALASAKLDRSLFHPDLCFWSFRFGFSKPDPHVFRMLRARLQARGVPWQETLMVGDRRDNDIEPARSQGWQTWRLSKDAVLDSCAGDWHALGRQLGVL